MLDLFLASAILRDMGKPVRVWSLISTVGMLAFAGLYFCNPKPTPSVQEVANTITNTVIVTNTILNTVTNEVLKEVPKEVEKIVRVSAEIPDEYLLAKSFYTKIVNATPAPKNQVLFQMKDIRLAVGLSDALKTIISEDQVRSKFELTLRRNNVPVNQDSTNVVFLEINAFLDDLTQSTMTYNVGCYVQEPQLVFRNGECHVAIVTVWSKALTYGIAPKNTASEKLLENVERYAEIFANDFLSANGKSL